MAPQHRPLSGLGRPGPWTAGRGRSGVPRGVLARPLRGGGAGQGVEPEGRLDGPGVHRIRVPLRRTRVTTAEPGPVEVRHGEVRHGEVRRVGARPGGTGASAPRHGEVRHGEVRHRTPRQALGDKFLAENPELVKVLVPVLLGLAVA
ncbi:hypothetical protein AB0R11_27045, partial [Streptomyces fradiae]|uniref:hypothetical protein n=1 Tax=Streptomyces fradiae TaxID=1906 RepID=UPI003419E94B